MLKLNAAEYVRICSALQAMRNAISAGTGPADTRLTDTIVSAASDSLMALDLRASCVHLLRMTDNVAAGRWSLSELAQAIKELESRIADEMDARYYFCLTPREARYYYQPQVGWEEVITRFPSSITDIEEAQRCFALDRYAAAVFHSVHIVEFGLLELGAFLSVADPHSGWTAVSNQLQNTIRKRHQDRTQFEKDNFAFIEQVHATVEALKNAWRNKVSHAHAKLVVLPADFNREIAEEILFAARSFMRRLAGGLPPSSS